MRVSVSIAFQSLAILGVAAFCALISNGLARPERRLAWTAAPPPTAKTASAVIPAPIPIPTQTEVPPPAPPARPAIVRDTRVMPPPPQLPNPTEVPFHLWPGQPIREISSNEAGEAFKAKVPFLDARRSAEYESGHVKGAWSLPIWESTLEERLVEFEAKANRPPEAALVLYCSGGSCEDSHLLASRLFKMGYRNLLIYTDGYPDWAHQGRPITKGQTR